jgi:hypothetical protein
MRFKILVLAGLMVATLAACGGSKSSSTAEDPQALATDLINQYITAVFERDQEALGNLLSDAYVLRRTDRSGYDREGYVAALAEGSDYGFVNYTVSDITAKQDGDILVAEFVLDADIEEGGQSMTSEPSPSLVTFVRVDGEWKLASDAFYSK